MTLTNLFSIIYNNFHDKDQQQKSPGQTLDQSSQQRLRRCPKLYIFTPFTVPRAWYSVSIRTAVRACVSRLALVAGSLVAGRILCGGIARAGDESPSDQGRGTSAASGAWPRRRSAALCGRPAGSGAPRKGDLRLPGAAEETDVVGRQTASGAWAGTAQKSERAPTPKRGTTFPANWHCPTNRSTTPQRRRGLPPAQGVARSLAERTHAAPAAGSNADGCILDARNTSDGVHPGRGVEE